jgi:hypothetical protein
VDPSEALQQLANDLCTRNGQQLFARPTFLAPNGGHHVLATMSEPFTTTEHEVVLVKKDAILDAVLGDCIVLANDTIFPPTHAFGIGPIAISMGRSGVCTHVARLGTAKDWKGAKVVLSCKIGATTITGGRAEGDHTVETWYLEKWKGKGDLKDSRWNKTFEFKAEVLVADGDAPPAQTATFVAVPKLASLDVSVDGERVVFVGKTEAMPTSAALAIRCEYVSASGGWEIDNDVTGKIRYARKYRDNNKESKIWGSAEENLAFGASVATSLFDEGTYRFIWHVTMFSDMGVQSGDLSLEVEKLGVSIAPYVTRSFAKAELSAGAPAESEAADE